MLSLRPETSLHVRGWAWVQVGANATEIRDRAGTESRYPVLSVTKHRGILPASEYFKKPVHGKDLANYKIVRRGQIAYATIHLDEGSVGILRDHEAGLVSPMYTVLEINGQIDPEYLLAVLKTSKSQALFKGLGQGTVNRRASIAFRTLGQLFLHLPSLPEQRKIATILASVDVTIEKTKTVIASLKTVRNKLLNELLARGVRGQHTRFKAVGEEWQLGRLQGVGEIPACWQLVKLTSVARLESGHTPSRKRPEYWSGDIPWLSLHDSKRLETPEIFDTEQKISALGLANSSARLLPKGTVVFSRTATVGKSTILGREMATSQDFANYVCGQRIYNRYLMHFLRHNRSEWDRVMAGSTHKTIYMPVFQNLQIPLPPYEEQVKIADLADRLDTRLARENDVIDCLLKLKYALSNSLLTGELRITSEETLS